MHFSTDMSSSNNKCVLTPQEAAPYDKIDLIRSSNSFEYTAAPPYYICV